MYEICVQPKFEYGGYSWPNINKKKKISSLSGMSSSVIRRIMRVNYETRLTVAVAICICKDYNVLEINEIVLNSRYDRHFFPRNLSENLKIVLQRIKELLLARPLKFLLDFIVVLV